MEVFRASVKGFFFLFCFWFFCFFKLKKWLYWAGSSSLQPESSSLRSLKLPLGALPGAKRTSFLGWDPLLLCLWLGAGFKTDGSSSRFSQSLKNRRFLNELFQPCEISVCWIITFEMLWSSILYIFHTVPESWIIHWVL